MDPLDLTTMTDADLDALSRDVSAEQDRRSTVASASGLITRFVSEAVKAGVTEETVDAAVAAGLAPEQAAAPTED